MTLDATKWEITTDKNIRYTGPAHTDVGANWVTVLELHRWIQDLADDASSGSNDYMDITQETPSDKAFDTIINLINGYNINDASAQHIYGGSIIQAGGDEIYDGIQVIAGVGCHVEVVQNGALIATAFWNSIPNGETEEGINADVENGIAMRFMVKVRSAGSDIDGRRLLFQTREWGKTYSEFKVNGSARGVNVVPLLFADDLNNETAVLTVAGWAEIVNTEGYRGIDVDNDSTPEYYYSEWTRDAYTINQFFERMKWLTRRGTVSSIYGVNGDLFRGITHEVNITGPSGTFSAFEAVSWGSGATAGTGIMLAINSTTAGTKMWIQVLTGVAPSGTVTITGTSSLATAMNSGAPLERTLSFPFCGASTGSAIIGAYGFGIVAVDLTAADKVFDLTNTLKTPPNYVTFTVAGIVSGDDYVIVAPNDGGNVDFDQFILDGALTGAAVTAAVMVGDIPADTPSTGSIRILRASGRYTKHPYSSWTGKTFTITSHDFSTDNAANGANAFISYIDKLADAVSAQFTSVYLADRSLFIRVRSGGLAPIKTFESVANLASVGGSVTAVRTSDA